MSSVSYAGPKPIPAHRPAFHWHGARIVPLLVTLLIGVVIWFLPMPQGVSELVNSAGNPTGAQAWHLFAIFVATIAGLILKPLPMGAVALIGIGATSLLGVLPVASALSGFSNTTIWLIVLAFFVARGFIKTGLGTRIAYLFVRLLGRRTLGLSYGLILSDLVLAPAIPSNTARAGGVVYPILKSLATVYGSDPKDGTARKIGAFLTKAAFQGTVITSAMFLTAMAANPMAQKLAGDMGIEITWGSWALAALVPGILSLLVVPYIIYKVYPPEIKETPGATQLAREKLAEMGRITQDEWMMIGVFVALLLMWIFGSTLGIDATVAALIGLGLLLISGVLSWDDVKKEEGAWDTLVWFAALVMMASFLNSLGLIGWFSSIVGESVTGISWVLAFGILALVYFYSHYLFASATAHVSAMYAAFLAVAVAVGTPPLLAALVLAFFSNLFASTTHYGTGPAPVLFGSGFVELADWWKIGFLVSVVNIVIWLGVGTVWWKVLGLF